MVEFIGKESSEDSAEAQETTGTAGIQAAQNTAYGESHNHYFYADEASLDGVVVTGDNHFLPSKPNDNADRRLAEGNFAEIPLRITDSEYQAFSAYVDGIDVDYTFSGYYQIDPARKASQKYVKERRSQKDHFDEPICDIREIPSQERLNEVIEANSSRYLEAHPGFLELDLSERKTVIRIIYDMLVENNALFSEEDRSRIYSLLNDISIVGIDSYDYTVNDLRKPYNARVLEDGTIIIDLKTIESYLKDENAKEKTYEHEIYHLFQRMCPDAQIKGYTQIGSCQYFDDLKVNSLHWNWLYEAAAEKKVMNRYQATKPLVYKNMIGYLKSLDLITLIRPGYENTAVEDSTLTVDENRMFELLGADSPEEEEEIIELLYSIDYLQNNREDFELVYSASERSLPEEERIKIKRDMKNSICLSFAKIFYRNLAERICNTEVCEQDVFYLINAFEEDVSYHTYYDQEQADYSYFIKEYAALQDAFFNLLAGNDPAKYKALVSDFDAYAMVILTPGGYERNCSLKWLTEEEKTFVFEEMVTGHIDYMTVNIRSEV